jgi:hypothetical protein
VPDLGTNQRRGGLLPSGPANNAPPAEVHELRASAAEGNLSLPAGGRELFNGGKPVPGQLVGPVLPADQDSLGADSARGGRSGERRNSTFASKHSQEEREPVIEVTIGRIEIRAETSGASNRKTERPASPVMGLDEYLRRKSNRGNA